MLAAKIARVRAIGWERASVEPPRLWPDERRTIARCARNAAPLPVVTGPKQLARALGIAVHCVPVPGGCGGEISDAHRVVYAWHPDPSERRLRVAHGLAHALLRRGAWDHTETDALLLTLDLA